MRTIKNSLVLLLVVLVAFSCKKEPLPFGAQFNELEKGGFSRLLSTDGANFFLTDPDNSAFTFDVEYYSENNGADIVKNEWFVRHRNNVDGTISEPVLMKSVSSSEFGTDPKSGLPSYSFTFTLNDAVAALGKTLDDLNGGDDIIFDGFIELKDGRRFGPDNTGGSVQGGAGFDGIFRWVKPLLCTSELAGTYHALTTVTNQGAGIGWDGCDGATWEGDVEFVLVGDGQYIIKSTDNGVTLTDMTMGAYYACYGIDSQGSTPNGEADPPTLTIVDACGNLSWRGNSQWGEVYSWSEVTVNGSELKVCWTNDYGEGACTVITRPDGTDWPPLKAN